MSKTYFCTKCDGNHRYGKIWEDHQQYRKKEVVSKKIEAVKLLPFDPLTMRSIALRQIGQLFYRMGLNGRKNMYLNEINKIIIDESGRGN